MNDKKAAINIYITNEKRKITNTDLFEYGISGFGGICERDKNMNIVIACAHYKYDFGLKPPKYEQIFPSIATHGLVSLNSNYSIVLNFLFLLASNVFKIIMKLFFLRYWHMKSVIV